MTLWCSISCPCRSSAVLRHAVIFTLEKVLMERIEIRTGAWGFDSPKSPSVRPIRRLNILQSASRQPISSKHFFSHTMPVVSLVRAFSETCVTRIFLCFYPALLISGKAAGWVGPNTRALRYTGTQRNRQLQVSTSLKMLIFFQPGYAARHRFVAYSNKL